MSKAPKPAPVTVNRLNNLFADLRGAPVATIEMYSRNLRKADLLPETKRGGGVGIMPAHAAQMLVSIMRGSPINAATNAAEIGGLIVHDTGEGMGGGLTESIVEAGLAAIGWEDSITFADAIGWVIESFASDTINAIAADPASFRIEVDRYWTNGFIEWLPSQAVADALFAAASGVFGAEGAASLYDRHSDGKHHRRLRMGFASRHLFDVKDSYRQKDWPRNRAAHAAHQASKMEAEKLDLFGSERVGHRTISAIADLFRASR